MATIKTTLIKKMDDETNNIYPKTSADVVEYGDTTVSGSNIPVQIVAPKAAGSYTLKFEYTGEDGKTVSKTVNLNVAAKSTRR